MFSNGRNYESQKIHTQYMMPHMQIKPKSILRKCDLVGRVIVL